MSEVSPVVHPTLLRPIWIVGLGQAVAGDDGVGLRVVAELQREGFGREAELEDAIELGTCTEPLELIERLPQRRLVILVDALVGAGEPGVVHGLDPEALDPGQRALSSHGIPVGAAIALARAVHGGEAWPRVRLVAITIDRPAQGVLGLSKTVAEALPVAIQKVREEIRSCMNPSSLDASSTSS